MKLASTRTLPCPPGHSQQERYGISLLSGYFHSCWHFTQFKHTPHRLLPIDILANYFATPVIYAGLIAVFIVFN